MANGFLLSVRARIRWSCARPLTERPEFRQKSSQRPTYCKALTQHSVGPQGPPSTEGMDSKRPRTRGVPSAHVERRRVSGWCYRAGAPSKTRGGTAQALAGFNVKDGHTRGARIHMTRVTVPQYHY